MDFLPLYNAVIRSELKLKDTNYNKCACSICAENDENEYDDDKDILTSDLHPNVKAGFARYRDWKETKKPVGNLKLSPSEMQRAMDGLSDEDLNRYDPFGKPCYKDVFKGGKRSPIKGYTLLDDKSIECHYCKKVTDTTSEDFICLRIMDVESRKTKNSCCVDLKKHGYSIVSYVWSDIDEVCDKVGEEYYGIDGEPLINNMQKLLNPGLQTG
ncbi:hypothetical protein BGZ76_006409, partial [Entomortierella beljakovae]